MFLYIHVPLPHTYHHITTVADDAVFHIIRGLCFLQFTARVLLSELTELTELPVVIARPEEGLLHAWPVSVVNSILIKSIVEFSHGVHLTTANIHSVA